MDGVFRVSLCGSLLSSCGHQPFFRFPYVSPWAGKKVQLRQLLKGTGNQASFYFLFFCHRPVRSFILSKDRALVSTLGWQSTVYSCWFALRRGHCPVLSKASSECHLFQECSRLQSLRSLVLRSKLQDAVPASPYAEVEETVRRELGRPMSSLFASIEKEALASASVAQVHRCTLKDGREAVIKVRQ